jgi:crotonobetainyl-CoA:carnitine CoA-transferase CaiB-like acyl-CoA transferase
VGYDQIAQGETGLMSVSGPDPDHPTRVGVLIGCIFGGLNGVIGVAAALAGRQLTERGTIVRMFLLAGFIGAHAFQGPKWTVERSRAAWAGTSPRDFQRRTHRDRFPRRSSGAGTAHPERPRVAGCRGK